MRQAFLSRLSALDQIRAGIYLSGTYVRDFLLSPDTDGAQAQAARLMSLERDTRAAIDAYARSAAPDERKPFQDLRSEIEAYWQVLDSTLAWSQGERDRMRYSFFYDELVPRRTTMLQIADRIATVNERGLARAEDELASSSERLRRSLMLTFAITLIGGTVLALATIGRTIKLERQLEQRLDENARARADLRDLSARLLRAQENERRNLARELHDEVGQSLSAILMETEGAACAEGQSEVREHLASIRDMAEKNREPGARPGAVACGRRCWTILVWSRRSSGKPVRWPNARAYTSPCRRKTRWMACRMSIKPASTALSRRLSTTRRAMLTRATWKCEFHGRAAASPSQCATMARDSIRGLSAGSAARYGGTRESLGRTGACGFATGPRHTGGCRTADGRNGAKES